MLILNKPKTNVEKGKSCEEFTKRKLEQIQEGMVVDWGRRCEYAFSTVQHG